MILTTTSRQRRPPCWAVKISTMRRRPRGVEEQLAPAAASRPAPISQPASADTSPHIRAHTHTRAEDGNVTPRIQMLPAAADESDPRELTTRLVRVLTQATAQLQGGIAPGSQPPSAAGLTHTHTQTHTPGHGSVDQSEPTQRGAAGGSLMLGLLPTEALLRDQLSAATDEVAELDAQLRDVARALIHTRRDLAHTHTHLREAVEENRELRRVLMRYDEQYASVAPNAFQGVAPVVAHAGHASRWMMLPRVCVRVCTPLFMWALCASALLSLAALTRVIPAVETEASGICLLPDTRWSLLPGTAQAAAQSTRATQNASGGLFDAESVVTMEPTMSPLVNRADTTGRWLTSVLLPLVGCMVGLAALAWSRGFRIAWQWLKKRAAEVDGDAETRRGVSQQLAVLDFLNRLRTKPASKAAQRLQALSRIVITTLYFSLEAAAVCCAAAAALFTLSAFSCVPYEHAVVPLVVVLRHAQSDASSSSAMWTFLEFALTPHVFGMVVAITSCASVLLAGLYSEEHAMHSRAVATADLMHALSLAAIAASSVISLSLPQSGPGIATSLLHMMPWSSQCDVAAGSGDAEACSARTSVRGSFGIYLAVWLTVVHASVAILRASLRHTMSHSLHAPAGSLEALSPAAAPRAATHLADLLESHRGNFGASDAPRRLTPWQAVRIRALRGALFLLILSLWMSAINFRTRRTAFGPSGSLGPADAAQSAMRQRQLADNMNFGAGDVLGVFDKHFAESVMHNMFKPNAWLYSILFAYLNV